MPEGRLFVCATPIGNLGDISTRLAETLASVDVVYAEDTRRTRTLLQSVGASVPTRSLFAGNEMKRSSELLTDLEDGKQVALVSDAGMPGVSDPGAAAIEAAHDRGFSVTVVPGPSAVTAALAVSGLGGDRFVFEGFLERKKKLRNVQLDRIAGETSTVVVFASPHRLVVDLRDLEQRLGGERKVVVTRELTKLHEELWRGTLAEAVQHWSDDVKGEITLVIGAGEPRSVSEGDAVELAKSLVADGSSLSDAARAAASQTGVSRRAIYQALVDSQA